MLSSLRLINFRCFTQLSLEIAPQGAIFTGDNAQGKTTILEAICLLIRLHSPRTRNLQELVHFDSSSFGIAGTAWEHENQVRYSKGHGVSLRIDEDEVERQRDYLSGGGLLVWLANDDLALIRGSSSSRRRYMDFIGTQLWPDYRRALANYNYALKCRNRLLKNTSLDARLLNAYEKLMAEHGGVLINLRKELVTRLTPLTSQAQRDLSGKHESLSMQLKSCDPTELLKLFFENRESDFQRGCTLKGPHRDDIEFRINQQRAGKFASEGQQRTLSIALKLAQGRLIEDYTKKNPIYLIDDVFGELDTSRRQALIRNLPASSQILITTTNLDWLSNDSPDLPHFTVANTAVIPAMHKK